MPSFKRLPAILLAAVVISVVAAGCGGSGGQSGSVAVGADVSSQFGTQYQTTGTGPMVAPTVPQTPGVQTLMGTNQGNTRSYDLTAGQFRQQIANFPLKMVKIWGYNGGTPGPTLIAYEGERVRVTVKNDLPPTQLKPSMPRSPR